MFLRTDMRFVGSPYCSGKGYRHPQNFGRFGMKQTPKKKNPPPAPNTPPTAIRLRGNERRMTPIVAISNEQAMKNLGFKWRRHADRFMNTLLQGGTDALLVSVRC